MDFEIRAFHLDLRVQVMKLNALKDLAREIKTMGFNTLIMEWEASYPFKKHPVIPSAFAYSEKEVSEFLKVCRELKLDVIPLQQCFGHVEYILRHDRYASLREAERDICQLCPIKVDPAVELFTDLFGELCKTHPSKYIHIGCDETYLLGNCKSCSEKSRKFSKSKLFVDYVAAMCRIVKKLGRRPIIWADMLLAHPEAASELPKDLILVDWNYGWENDRFGSNKPLLKTGLEFWGAPALRSGPDDNYLVDFEKHLRNFRDFIPFSKNSGYQGIVLTSWSTSGMYGIEWGTHFEPIDLFPIRRVFPLKGCRLLLAAFVNAIDNEKPINPDVFTEKYAVDRFGLKAGDAKNFRKALFADAAIVYNGKTSNKKSISAILKDVTAAYKALKAIKPSANKEEYDLFILYFAIRKHAIAFKVLEEEVNKTSYKDSRTPKILSSLSALLKEADALDTAFTSAFKGYLFASEIKEENRYRRRKLKDLYCRLSRKKD